MRIIDLRMGGVYGVEGRSFGVGTYGWVTNGYGVDCMFMIMRHGMSEFITRV